MMAGKQVEGKDLVVPWRKVFMKEESTNQMKKEMWKGTHFEKMIGGSGKVLNVSL
jgi:hypothetical protein